MPRSKMARVLPVVAAVVLADVVTKALAVRYLVPQRVPHDVLGEWLRLTLVYNPGAAFGLHVGEHSRWVFMALTVIALGILGSLYRATRAGEGARLLALALVTAGAIGNLIDRVRSDMGVVDFLDVGVGATRWPTFNVADMAVSGGAMLLAWVLWREDQAADAAAPAEPAPVPVATPPRIS